MKRIFAFLLGMTTILAMGAGFYNVATAVSISGPLNNQGKVSVSYENFLIEVAKGNVPGHSIVNKFGENPAVTTATDPEDVWAGGGIYDFYPTSAQSVLAASTDADDTDGGAGARTITFYGLDASWNAANETVTLNGTNSVALTNTYRRMFRGVVLTAGASSANEGDITVTNAAGDVAIHIDAGDGQTQQAIYTVPNNTTAYFLKGYVGMSDGGNSASRESVQFKWKARLNNGVNGAWATKGQIECINDGATWWQYEYGAPSGPLPEKTDVRIEAVEVSATLGVVGGFDLLLVEDGY
jgi:hypothetical protein